MKFSVYINFNKKLEWLPEVWVILHSPKKVENPRFIVRSLNPWHYKFDLEMIFFSLVTTVLHDSSAVRSNSK